MTEHPITPPPHLLNLFSAQARNEAKKVNGRGYLKSFAMLCIEWAMNPKTTPNDRQIRSSEITPPLELVRQWMERTDYDEHTCFYESYIAEQAAQWGADMELDECCAWLSTATYGDTLGVYSTKDVAVDLRAARRPKPPSLKEQALKELKDWTDEKHGPGGEVFLCEGLSVALIRQALESLPD